MKKFVKNKENFICENCGHETKGSGYTNHCPKCLFSKHVDLNPGDRLALCGGLMIPHDFEMKNSDYIIIHKCQKCGHIKKNRTSKDDNLEILISISRNKES